MTHYIFLTAIRNGKYYGDAAYSSFASGKCTSTKKGNE